VRLLSFLLLLAGCDAARVYAFHARRFDSARNCLYRTSALDVLEGDGGTCNLRCLVSHEDGGPTVYITTDCPPYPPGYDPTELDPRCGPAKAAYDRNDTCLDAGSTHPIDASSE
jgi:hypothetical protein